MCPAPMPPRIHVLGLGSIGTFIAHSLVEAPDKPSLTLLLHRSSLLDGYFLNAESISLETREGNRITHSNHNLELLKDDKWYSVTSNPRRRTSDAVVAPNPLSNDIIDHLIVCVKATQTVSALRPLLPRLAPHSTILLLQNGAGMIEDVNKHLFPNPNTRPNFIVGVISHGVTTNSPFNITHTGCAAASIGLVPRSIQASNKSSTTDESRYLLQVLPQVARLSCQSYDWPDIIQLQLEKLSVNAVCNPLCALADSPNMYIFTIPDIYRALISEISSVILALPEVKDIAGIAMRFSPKALESTVMSVLEKTRETTCSMVWDLRAGRETEIRYINGFWIRKGREVSIATPLNDELLAKIEGRASTRK